MKLLIRDGEREKRRERQNDWKKDGEREEAASGKDPLISCTHYASSTMQPLQINVRSN